MRGWSLHVIYPACEVVHCSWFAVSILCVSSTDLFAVCVLNSASYLAPECFWLQNELDAGIESLRSKNPHVRWSWNVWILPQKVFLGSRHMCFRRYMFSWWKYGHWHSSASQGRTMWSEYYVIKDLLVFCCYSEFMFAFIVLTYSMLHIKIVALHSFGSIRPSREVSCTMFFNNFNNFNLSTTHKSRKSCNPASATGSRIPV